jgi:hypothetical protein
MQTRANLSHLISLLVPSSRTALFSTFRELRSSQLLVLDNIENLTYQNMTITRIRLIAAFTDTRLDDIGVYLASRVLLTHNNVEKSFHFEADDSELKEYYNDLYCALMLCKNVQAEFANCVTDERAMPFAKWQRGNKSVYSETEKKFYTKARQVLAYHLKSFLKTKYSTAYNEMPIRLVSLGCGDGDDIHQTLQELRDEMKVIEAFGIDNSEANILTAEEKHGQHAIFIQDNIANLTNIMNKINRDPSIVNIAIAVGCLTRCVNNGTLEVLRILQQAFKYFQVVAITGYTAPLITLAVARAMGLNALLLNYKSNDLLKPREVKMLYILWYPNAVELAELLLSKLKVKKALLDLSMSANPELHLKLFSQLYPSLIPTIQYIDLTFAFISEKDEFNGLKEALRPYLAVKEIYYNNATDLPDNEFNLLRAVTRPHSEHELPFYLNDIEQVLEQTQPKPAIVINPLIPILTKAKSFCFFKIHSQNFSYLTELRTIVGSECIRFHRKQACREAYLSMSWLKQLSPNALDELSNGAKCSFRSL